MSYSDNPTSYRGGVGVTSTNGSGMWDDSERSEDDSRSSLGIIVEENDREYSVYDVPLDGSTRGTTSDTTGSTIHTMGRRYSDEENDGGGSSSLPHVEEVKAMKGKTGSKFRKAVRGRRRLFIAGAVLLLVLILLISIPTSKKTKASNASSNTNSTNKNNKGSLTFANRNSTREDVFQFLKDQNVYIDAAYIKYIEETAKSPQHLAAVWLSREDKADVKVPHKDADEQAIYHYLVRYIMAVNYYSFDGPNWRNQLNFLTHTNVCEWQANIFYGTKIIEAGVFCNDEKSGRPNELKLFANKLKGTIPTENALLTTLTVLDFSSNDLVTGTIPTQLCNLLQLQKFDVSWNTMTGNIPPCIGTTMSNLQWLYLPGNALIGTIPTHMGNMTQLQRFIIEDNMFTGNPISIWNAMTELKMLYASHNNFTGFINENFIPHHKNLEILDVSDNQFTYETSSGKAAFPHHLLTLFNLTHLDLSNNPLHGSFPRTLFPKPSVNHVLEYLSVYNTQMSGSLPDLHKLIAIKHMDMSKNDFRGNIPLYYGANNTNLELLYLSDNENMSPGTIPLNFENLHKLRDLSLRNINVQGAIPSIIGTNLTNLVLLDLSLNNFTGKVPSNLANLRKLEYLLLNGNLHLSGGLHSVTVHHPQLKILLIDGTSIPIESLNCPFKIVESANVSALTVYTDCITLTSPPCECCKCCIDDDGFGCSNPLLASIDGSWLQTFDRTTYKIIEDGGHD